MTDVPNFEAAVDAIVSGDLLTFKNLLQSDPEIVRARSSRAHRSTLLHYVSANGVEDDRQKTPKNIVEIARLLLKAGADVNAESEAYGGHSTTLRLAATSGHPENAGVQLSLLALLLEHGAMIDVPGAGSDVNSCLHNGRREASEFLADHGAYLDLEGAAGVGKLDLVAGFFHEDGTLKPPATKEQMQYGFAWACEYGRTGVVHLLLHKGVDINATLRPHGQTGLHWAAYGGHADIVELLLNHGASVEYKDHSYEGTPLEWAIHFWSTADAKQIDSRAYYKTVALLARAGARLDDRWQQSKDGLSRAAVKVQSDSRMQAALRGEMEPLPPPGQRFNQQPES